MSVVVPAGAAVTVGAIPAGRAGLGDVVLRHSAVQVDEGVPAGKVQPALIVNFQHLHLYHVAYIYHVCHFLCALDVQAGNVYQAFLARGNLYESAEVHQAGDPTVIVGARLRIVYNGVHNV